MLLKLLQLADSALPIGTTAHSFGLETLAAEGIIDQSNLAAFFEVFLEENGLLEVAFVRAAHSTTYKTEPWIELNALMSARKPARESRTASISLGRRILALANELEPADTFTTALAATSETHLACAFGLVASQLEIPEDSTVLAYLQQSITGLVSACQRLLPLGQTAAARLIWRLKPTIARVAQASVHANPAEVSSFAPMIEIAGMRHPALETRLFVS